MRHIKIFAFKFQLATAILFLFPSFLVSVYAQVIDEATAIINSPVVFINPYIENGSSFNWMVSKDSILYIQQVYDYERSAKNRTAEHWHFLLEAEAGTDFTIVFQSFGEIYNGKLEVMPSYMSCVVSEDGKKWRHIPTEWIKTPQGANLKMQVHMETGSLYIARVDPYRVSDLNKLLTSLEGNDQVQVTAIGKSVEGRELHIIRVGNEDAPNRIFIRGRVHPWEPGGNWVIEGLIETLLKDTKEVKAYLKNYCLYILPMSNIDGVANGVTRFNMKGMDLNRALTKPADPVLAPENLAMEIWLEDMISKGMKPDLAIDFHNDSNGPLIFAPPRENPETYLDHMKIFETLLRGKTWFSEYTVTSDAETSTMFARGLMDRYGIESLVYELHSNWIEGLNKRPLSDDWILLGKQLCEVFDEYFKKIDSE